MKLNEGLNDQLMAMASYRYCIGRQSYIVGACCEWIHATWDQFTTNTKLVMVRDIIEALQDERAGSPTVDAPRWREVCEWAWKRIDEDGKCWVRSGTRWRGPMPFDDGESKAD
jgi:hypothetical protein